MDKKQIIRNFKSELESLEGVVGSVSVNRWKNMIDQLTEQGGEPPRKKKLNPKSQAILDEVKAKLTEQGDRPTITEDRWISVEDELPSLLTHKLTFTDDIHSLYILEIGFLSTDGETWINLKGDEIFPSHWQPLPKPPQY